MSIELKEVIAVVVYVITAVGTYWKLKMDIQKLFDKKIDVDSYNIKHRELEDQIISKISALKKEVDEDEDIHTTRCSGIKERVRDLEVGKVGTSDFNKITQQLNLLEAQVDNNTAAFNNRFTQIEGNLAVKFGMMDTRLTELTRGLASVNETLLKRLDEVITYLKEKK